ncbi:ABC transporter permease [Dehalococcoidia bacterium]|nr:ABC transporter permease [Dehalococcoidia bacterium]
MTKEQTSRIDRPTTIRNQGSMLIKRAIAPLLTILPEIVAVCAAFLIGAIILWVTGHPIGETFYYLFYGAFGSRTAIGTTLTRATPLIFTGLAFSVAFKCGVFNIGAEGQLYVGAFAAAWVGFSLPPMPPVIHITLALAAGAAAGVLWVLIPAVLKAKRGVHEVVTTMMLAHVGILLTRYLSYGPFKAPGWIPHTERIAPTAELVRIMPPTQLSTALFIALFCALAVYLFLWKTSLGYGIRAAGLNPTAAEAGGVPVARSIILALLLSGALAGLGGTGEILGVFRRFIDGFSPGYGWYGIAVGLLGRLHPIGVILSALLFGALHVGGTVVDRATGVPLDITVILQAIVILFIGAPKLMKFIRRRG